MSTPSDVIKKYQAQYGNKFADEGYYKGMEAPNDSAFNRGLMHGLYSLAGSGGTIAEYLGGLTGIEPLKQWGEDVYQSNTTAAEKYAPPESIQGSIFENPSLLKDSSWWVYNIADTLPSLAASMVPAGAAAKGISIAGKVYEWTPQLITKLARIGSMGVGGLAGGSLEGASTYQTVKQRGGTDEEARRAMELMTLASGGLNAVSLGKLFGKPASGFMGLAKHIGEAATTEAITEYLEEPSEALILGDDVLQRMKQGLNVIPIAFVTGGLGAGGNVAYETGKNTIRRKAATAKYNRDMRNANYYTPETYRKIQTIKKGQFYPEGPIEFAQEGTSEGLDVNQLQMMLDGGGPAGIGQELFKSRLAEEVQKTGTRETTAANWINIIKGMQSSGKVKPAEVEYTQILQKLQKMGKVKVSNDLLQKTINEANPKLEVVMRVYNEGKEEISSKFELPVDYTDAIQREVERRMANEKKAYTAQQELIHAEEAARPQREPHQIPNDTESIQSHVESIINRVPNEDYWMDEDGDWTPKRWDDPETNTTVYLDSDSDFRAYVGDKSVTSYVDASDMSYFLDSMREGIQERITRNNELDDDYRLEIGGKQIELVDSNFAVPAFGTSQENLDNKIRKLAAIRDETFAQVKKEFEEKLANKLPTPKPPFKISPRAPEFSSYATIGIPENAVPGSYKEIFIVHNREGIPGTEDFVSHYSEPDIIGFARTWVVKKDGKYYIVLDEIQSDWVQQFNTIKTAERLRPILQPKMKLASEVYKTLNGVSNDLPMPEDNLLEMERQLNELLFNPASSLEDRTKAINRFSRYKRNFSKLQDEAYWLRNEVSNLQNTAHHLARNPYYNEVRIQNLKDIRKRAIKVMKELVSDPVQIKLLGALDDLTQIQKFYNENTMGGTEPRNQEMDEPIMQKTWREPLLKYMVRHAAMFDYAGIAWPNEWHVAPRYSGLTDISISNFQSRYLPEGVHVKIYADKTFINPRQIDRYTAEQLILDKVIPYNELERQLVDTLSPLDIAKIRNRKKSDQQGEWFINSKSREAMRKPQDWVARNYGETPRFFKNYPLTKQAFKKAVLIDLGGKLSSANYEDVRLTQDADNSFGGKYKVEVKRAGESEWRTVQGYDTEEEARPMYETYKQRIEIEKKYSAFPMMPMTPELREAALGPQYLWQQQPVRGGDYPSLPFTKDMSINERNKYETAHYYSRSWQNNNYPFKVQLTAPEAVTEKEIRSHAMRMDPQIVMGHLKKASDRYQSTAIPITDSAEQRTVINALKDMLNSGVPSVFINNINGIAYFDGPTDSKIMGRYDKFSRVVLINRNIVQSITHFPGMERSRRMLVNSLMHEFAHSFDDKGLAGMHSETSPMFRVDPARVSMNSDGTMNVHNAFGKIIEEMNNARTMKADSGWLSKFLSYPFNMLPQIADMNPKSMNAKDRSAITRFKAEAFAQLTALYYTNPTVVYELMPTAYDFMEGIHDAASRPDIRPNQTGKGYQHVLRAFQKDSSNGLSYGARGDAIDSDARAGGFQRTAPVVRERARGSRRLFGWDDGLGEGEFEQRRTLGETGVSYNEPEDVLRTRKPLPEYAGAVKLSTIWGDDDLKSVWANLAEQNNALFDDQKRGKVSREASELAAKALGMTEKEVLTRAKGQAWNDAQLLAAGQIAQVAMIDLQNKAKDAAANENPQALADFEEAYARAAHVASQFSGARSEAGRALNVLKKMASLDRSLQDMIESVEDVETAAKKAAMIARLEDEGQVSKFAQESFKVRAIDVLLEVWMNALLSGPQTHAVNTFSNTMVSFYMDMENFLAAGIGMFRSGHDKVYLREAINRFAANGEGVRRGLKAFYHAVKNEDIIDQYSKLEQPRPHAISAQAWNLQGKTGKAVDIAGKGVRIPGRFLQAEDEFFKAVLYQKSIVQQAVHEALNPEYAIRHQPAIANDLINNPTKEMRQKALNEARYGTFTQPLGKLGRNIQSIVAAHPTLRFIVPFIRTPSNIVKFAAHRSPFAPLFTEVRQQLNAGGAQRDIALSRIAMGSTIGGLVVMLAAQGLVTGGGPSDPKEKQQWYATGWQPYSVLIGDKYYSFARLEPLGMLMGISADFAEIMNYSSQEDASHIAAMISGSIAKNLTSKTWLRGLAEALNAIQDPDRYGEHWVQQFAGTVVPTGVAQIARLEDPYLRNAQTISEKIKSRLPGQSQNIRPRLNIWGEPIALEGGVGPDIISPIYQSTLKGDRVSEEMIQLGYYPGMPSKKMGGVELNPDVYNQYVQLAGQNSKLMLDAMVSNPAFQAIPPYKRQEMIQETIYKARRLATKIILAQHPDIRAAQFQQMVNQIQGVK